MYNVLLVEDDELERELMRQSWVWQQSEFSLAADVSSGAEAWDILQQGKIDIVVTDISMPVMDGLELSKRIREVMPEIKIIILSGHSDFQYARQAISLGVSEYLVKTVKSEDLLEALRLAALKIQAEAQVNHEIQDYRQQLQNNRQYMRQTLLENLSIGNIPEETLQKEAELLDFDLNFQTVCCAIIVYLDDKILINNAEHLMILENQQIVDAFFKNLEIISFAHNLRENYLIFPNPDLDTIKDVLLQIHCRLTVHQQNTHRLYQPMIALGSVKYGINGIAESFSDARFLLNFHHLIGSQSLFFFDDARPIHQSIYNSELSLARDKELIINTLVQGSKNDVQGLVDNLIRQLQIINISLVFFQYTYIEIGKIIRNFLLEIGENPDEMLVDSNGLHNGFLSGDCLSMANDIPAFGEYLAQTLVEVIEIRNHKRKYQFHDVILKAKKYIDQHYDDPSLSLTSIASVVNVNPSYFSNLFSQEMGSTFIEYLTGIRIEKARVLLKTTNMRTSDVAFAVGYSDSNYFSKIFRKITAESPRSFKNAN